MVKGKAVLSSSFLSSLFFLFLSYLHLYVVIGEIIYAVCTCALVLLVDVVCMWVEQLVWCKEKLSMLCVCLHMCYIHGVSCVSILRFFLMKKIPMFMHNYGGGVICSMHYIEIFKQKRKNNNKKEKTRKEKRKIKKVIFCGIFLTCMCNQCYAHAKINFLQIK